MRRTMGVLLGVIVVLLAAGSAFAEYDISGRWNLEGSGYAEKRGVRVELSDDGYLDIHTETRNGTQYLTGYDVQVNLYASKLGIDAWEYRDSVTLQTAIEIPELNPTTSEPFELPPVTVDGMTYAITFTSTTSGTVDIYGDLDVDKVGEVAIDSESAIWKDGTEKPDIEDKSSGCNAGGWPIVLSVLFLPAVLRGRRA